MARGDIENFYRALCARDYATVAGFLSDDVEWTIGGPVDVLPFCGTHRGKDRVLAAITRKIGQTLGKRHIEPEMFLVDGDRGAALGRLTAKRPDGGTISYRIAQFFAFRDGKLVQFRSVLDSFDAAEQIVGHRIALPMAEQRGEHDKELIAV